MLALTGLSGCLIGQTEKKTRPRLAKERSFEVVNFYISSVNESTERIFFDLDRGNLDLQNWIILVRTNTKQIYYIEKMDLRGTIAFAKSPYILLQYQNARIQTPSISTLKFQGKPFIFCKRNEQIEIFQEDTEKIEALFAFFEQQLGKTAEEFISALKKEENQKMLLFKAPEEWYWFSDSDIM